MDIVVKNVLEAIHYVLEHNEFEFTNKQIEKADEIITPFIKELNIDSKEFNVITYSAPKFAYNKRIEQLLIKYFAYIEDNISLYEELLKDKYIFTGKQGIKFYALDRVMTSNFKINEYKNLLYRHEEPISKFYFTLKGLSKSDKEKYSKEFSDIVHIDQTTLKVGFDKYENINHYNYLTKENIEYFGKDFLLRLDEDRRNIINNINIKLSKEDAKKIKELLIRYPNYSGIIDLSNELLSNFSIDEINAMSKKDAILYETSIKANLLYRMRNILTINPEFNCPTSFIREEIFKILSDEEIINLREDTKTKISESIPEIDGVIVLPIKKIKRIVFNDKIMNKFDSIIGNRKR